MNGGRNYIYSGGSGIEENYSIGVEVQIPIFTGFRDTYRIREEQARASAAQEEFRSKELTVAREVWSAFFRFEASQRQTQSAKALLAASAESYRAVETGYANGTNSVLDLLAAQREMSEARKSLIASQANCGIAYVELALATGGLSD
jgi:outer membrane protein TolC